MRYISDYKDNLFFINALNEPTKVWKIKLVPLARVKDEAYGYAYKEMDEAISINEEFIQSWDMSQELCEGNFNFGNFNREGGLAVANAARGLDAHLLADRLAHQFHVLDRRPACSESGRGLHEIKAR